jgi:hypothetical protein
MAPMRTFAVALVVTLLALSAPPRAAAPNWHVTATVAESCSCTVSCSCNFGGEPNRNPCEGNRLIAIKSGHFESVDLSGVSFLVTFNMRNWSKIYLSDKVSAAQEKAVEALLPIAFAGFHRGMLSFTKAPITMDITEKRVTFSGPESSVEMEVMRGFDGKSVKILNLPNAAYQDYTQYRSVSHKHSSDKATWNHSGTNGFTSTMDVGSDK